MYGIGRKFKRYFGNLNLSASKRELIRIKNQPLFQPGYAHVFEKPFKFNDGKSFYDTYLEIFQNKIYQFIPAPDREVILDCGANMGLSVLYFAKSYPHHHIIAFEPDPLIFDILRENVLTFNLQNVTLHNKAVWNKEETLTFFTDQGMGGRVENSYADQEPTFIDTVSLRDFISSQVDFLKMDIEGAEDTVLNHCSDKLGQLNNIFFEYHNNVNKEQTLHKLLELLKNQGFHYYLKESAARARPFIDNELICETFDMAINVFCYKRG